MFTVILNILRQLTHLVHRDLNFTKSVNTSSSSLTTCPVGVTSLSGIRGSGGSVVGKGTPVISEYSAQLSKDHNVKSVDDMLAKANQLIEGVYRDFKYTPTVNTSSSSSTTSPVGVTSLFGIWRSGGSVAGKGTPVISPVKRRKMESETARSFQTPEVLRTPVCHNNRNVFYDIHPVVYLSTSQLNRQRLPYTGVGDSCCAGPSAARIRRTEPSPFTQPVDSSFSDTDKTSNTGPSSSATADNTGGTPFMCPVCMESCLQRQPTSTKCGHVFCKECIEQAIRVTHKCPMCNTKISQNQTFRIYL